MRHLTVLLVLAAIAACGDETPSSPSAEQVERPVAKQPVALIPYRFDVVSTDPVEHGERLYAVLGCIGCHKPDLTGEDWSDPELGVLWTANLTQSAVVYSEDELITMIAEGKHPDRPLIDMPSYLFSSVHPEDLAALVGYMRSMPAKGIQHPDPTIGPKLAEHIASGDFRDSVQWVADMKDQAPPDLGPEHAYARLILRATCAECHGMDLEGSTEQMMDAPARPSLRMVLAYTAEEFSILMKTGKPIGDRELQVMGGVSRGRYSHFTDDEIGVIYNYLVELARRPLSKN